MNTPPTAAVNGSDIQVGDVLAFLSATHRVDDIQPASPATCALVGEGARVAYAGDGWAITLAPTAIYEILPRPTV